MKVDRPLHAIMILTAFHVWGATNPAKLSPALPARHVAASGCALDWHPAASAPTQQCFPKRLFNPGAQARHRILQGIPAPSSVLASQIRVRSLLALWAELFPAGRALN